MKKFLLIIPFFLLFAACKDTEPKISDPEGTQTVIISNGQDIDGCIAIKDGYFEGALFRSCGKMDNLGYISSIPKDNWAKTAEIQQGCGYIAYDTIKHQYYRMFVEDAQAGKIRYQTPFLGSETEILVNKSDIYDLIHLQNGEYKIIKFQNKTLLPFTILKNSKLTDGFITSTYEYYSTAENSPPDAICIGKEGYTGTEIIIMVNSEYDGFNVRYWVNPS